MEQLKMNCKNLILINLNEYDYLPYYVNTQKTHLEFEAQGIMPDEFAQNIQDEIINQKSDLYCDITVTACHESVDSSVILRVDKLQK